MSVYTDKIFGWTLDMKDVLGASYPRFVEMYKGDEDGNDALVDRFPELATYGRGMSEDRVYVIEDGMNGEYFRIVHIVAMVQDTGDDDMEATGYQDKLNRYLNDIKPDARTIHLIMEAFDKIVDGLGLSADFRWSIIDYIKLKEWFHWR